MWKAGASRPRLAHWLLGVRLAVKSLLGSQRD